MTTMTSFKDLMRAIALGDAETAHSVNQRLTADEHDRASVYSTAVMSVLLEQRFKDDSSRPAISRFVAEMEQNYAKASTPIKPLATEGVIRAFAGEEQLLDEISPEDQLVVQYPIIRKIVADSPELTERMEDVLNDAALLMEEWEQDE